MNFDPELIKKIRKTGKQVAMSVFMEERRKPLANLGACVIFKPDGKVRVKNIEIAG